MADAQRLSYFFPVLLCIAASSVVAQELYIEPRLSLGYEYSDNLFLSPDRFQLSEDDPVQTPVSDSILVLTPGFAARLTGRRTRLSLLYDIGRTSYDRYAELNSRRHNARVALHTDLTPATVLTFRDEWRRTEDPLSRLRYEVNRGPEDLAETDPVALGLRESYAVHSSVIGLTHQLNDSDSAYAEYSRSTSHEDAQPADDYVRNGIRSGVVYWSNSGWGGELEGAFEQGDFEISPDLDTWSGKVTAGRKLTPTVEFFGRYYHQYVQVTGPAPSLGGEYHVLNPEAGLTYNSRHEGSVAASAGFFQRDRSEGRDTTGLSGTLRLTRRSDRSRIDLYAATGHDSSTYSRARAEASTFHEVGARLDYAVSRAVSLGVSASFRRDDYDEIDQTTVESEPDTSGTRLRGDGESVGTGIMLRYQPRRWCALQLDYRFTARTADRPEDEYDESRVSIVLNLSAHQRFGSIGAPTDDETDL
jgi:hypothetical protein